MCRAGEGGGDDCHTPTLDGHRACIGNSSHIGIAAGVGHGQAVGILQLRGGKGFADGSKIGISGERQVLVGLSFARNNLHRGSHMTFDIHELSAVVIVEHAIGTCVQTVSQIDIRETGNDSLARYRTALDGRILDIQPLVNTYNAIFTVIQKDVRIFYRQATLSGIYTLPVRSRDGQLPIVAFNDGVLRNNDGISIVRAYHHIVIHIDGQAGNLAVDGISLMTAIPASLDVSIEGQFVFRGVVACLTIA